MDRIKVCSDADMSTGRSLQQAEQKLLALSSNPSCEDVNEALEFANHKVWERVTPERFAQYLEKEPVLGDILCQKGVVKRYDKVLATHMKQRKDSAEVLLSGYLDVRSNLQM